LEEEEEEEEDDDDGAHRDMQIKNFQIFERYSLDATIYLLL